MVIRLLSDVAGVGHVFRRGVVVDWRHEDSARQLIADEHASALPSDHPATHTYQPQPGFEWKYRVVSA